jgi:hypothetical protein
MALSSHPPPLSSPRRAAENAEQRFYHNVLHRVYPWAVTSERKRK